MLLLNIEMAQFSLVLCPRATDVFYAAMWEFIPVWHSLSNGSMGTPIVATIDNQHSYTEEKINDNNMCCFCIAGCYVKLC